MFVFIFLGVVFAASATLTFDELADEAVSLLQLSSKKVQKLESRSLTQRGWVDTHGTNFLCEVFGDPHVEKTFSTTSSVGDRSAQPDFNSESGIFHLTKSETCGLDVQLYNCPISRRNNFRDSYGLAMIQGLAIRSGDDVIQIAYKPFNVSQWRMPELVGLTAEQWVTKINEYCPDVDTDDVVAVFNDDNLFPRGLPFVIPQNYIVQNGVEQTRDLFRNDFHMWYRVYLACDRCQRDQVVRHSASRCEQSLFGVPPLPIITVNGVEQPDFDSACYANEWWNTHHRSQKFNCDLPGCEGNRDRELPGGYIQTRLAPIGCHGATAGATVLKHPEGLWEIAYGPTAQQAEPIVDRVESNWTHAVATENRWKYYDPEWNMELYVQPSCFPDDAVVPGTVCNAPVMACQEGCEITYPTVPIPPEESLFDADHLGRLCHTCNWNPGEGKTRVEWRWTGNGEHRDPIPVVSPMEECEMPPNNPDPEPGPAQICEDSEVPLVDAQAACAHFNHNEAEVGQCIMDFCVSGGNPDIPDEGPDDETPECVGGECDPSIVCESATVMDLSNLVQNNLGGLGPDEGDESLKFGGVTTLGDRVVDLIVEANGPYIADKPHRNGLKDVLGRIGLKAGTTTNLAFTFVDAELGTPVEISELAFSVFDLDTGKKGRGAESVEVCDADGAMVTASSSLDQSVSGGCIKFTATEAGTASDNPSQPNQLDGVQSGRTATYSLRAISTFNVALGIEQGFGQRLFLFAFHPAIACLGAEA